MNPFVAAEFFDLDGFAHATLFAPDRPVWEALGEPLDTVFDEFPGWQKSPVLPAGVHRLGPAGEHEGGVPFPHLEVHPPRDEPVERFHLVEVHDTTRTARRWAGWWTASAMPTNSARAWGHWARNWW